MGQIQSSIGLITGVPILSTVDQLMALAARPRDLIAARTQQLQAEQIAITELTSLTLAVQFAADQLGETSLFSKKNAVSSDTALITAAVTGQPIEGSYKFVPVRQAQAQQLLSSGFASLDEPIGEGSISFRFGSTLNEGISLDELNAGQGVSRGTIRITDRSGTSAVVDLSYARSVDDVLDAINANVDINVSAVATGDSFKLIDNTGQTVSNLIVQEVSGTTAAGLGLSGINVAAAEATGQDVLQLHTATRLSRLNNSNGVNFRNAQTDLEITFRDGSGPLEIDFGPIGQGPRNSTVTTTAANGVDAQVQFTAVNKGSKYDGVRIRFVDDFAISKGEETVEYDDSDPNDKTLTFRIDAGQTTANDIIAALDNDDDASALFTATTATGGDGSGLIDVSDTGTTTGGAAIDGSLGVLLNIINAADPARLSAAISAGGDRLELTDLTSGGGTFAVTSPNGGTTADDLGLTETAVGGVISGRRLQAGLKTSLLTRLDGGTGLGQLGSINLTDRSGASDSVDLSAAETLDDILNAINTASVGIVAQVNSARNGIVLNDVTAATASNLIVDNADATNTADKLKITFNDAENSVNSGSLDLQTISESTKLSDLNSGQGVFSGSFVITDTNLDVGVVKLNNTGAEITTVGGVIDAINALGIGVQAQINDTGDGILLLDTVQGSQTLEVKDLAGGTTAKDLNLAGKAVEVDIGGTPTQVIDGTYTVTIEIEAGDTLADLVGKINDEGNSFTASAFNDGSPVTPYRLSISNQFSGVRHQFQLDVQGVAFNFQEVVKAQDALILVGSTSNPAAGILASSPTNTFEEILDGVSLTLTGTSTNPVTINVTASDEEIVSTAQEFVDAFNLLRDKIDDLTFFNDVDNTTGVLFGSFETLRVERDLSNLVTGRLSTSGSIQTLAAVGIEINDSGKLSLDEEKIKEVFAENPDALTDFFTDEDVGVAVQINELIESLGGEDTSLLVNRAAALAAKIKTNEGRIDFFNGRLEVQRQRLLEQFYRMETVIAELQSNLNAIQAIQAVPPLTVA